MTILTLEVPDGILGDFQFAAGLTNASTLEFIGEISFAAFRIESGQVAPTAYIDAILPNPATQGKDTVEFMGHGEDPDGTIEAHEWSSNIDGILSTLEDFSRTAHNISVGTHTISYSVQDDDGAWSEPATETLTIIEGRHVYVNAITGADFNDGSQESPLRTITLALSVQGSQEMPVTVHVAAGTYSASTNGETFPLNINSWVSLVGDGPETTVLDAEDAAYHVLCCEDVSNVTIDGFKITGGNADGNYTDAESSGGGIYCLSSSPTISNNYIMLNYAAEDGGAIWCSSGSSPTIEGNSISFNSAESEGGAICCYDNSSPNILNNVISCNMAEGDHGSGGGIHCEHECSPTVSYNTINGNSAWIGAGMAFKEGCSPTISYNTIQTNSATPRGGLIPSSQGGGIYVSGGSPTISHNTIAYNTVDGTFASGGGIYCLQSSPRIHNNLIASNTVEASIGQGGGVFCQESSPIISNNTIVSNALEGSNAEGGGIFCYDCSPSIFDCIIWDNGDDLAGCSATYCCIQDFTFGKRNINDDPLFVTGPNGDYYLDRDSPCIDAGSRSADEAGLAKYTTQAKGTLDTGTVDMGYHYSIP